MTRRLAQQPLNEAESTPRGLVRQEHYELVPADPVRRVAPTHCRGQALRQRANALVARLMTETIGSALA